MSSASFFDHLTSEYHWMDPRTRLTSLYPIVDHFQCYCFTEICNGDVLIEFRDFQEVIKLNPWHAESKSEVCRFSSGLHPLVQSVSISIGRSLKVRKERRHVPFPSLIRRRSDMEV